MIAALVGAPATAAPPPVYVHMNGANMFLEDVVAVKPGQDVVFVNEDTGAHTIVGFNPLTGKTSHSFNGYVAGDAPATQPTYYKISFSKPGIYHYYCSVHAMLAMEPPEHVTVAKIRPGVDGFGDPMAGVIIVTTDAAILARNPPSSHQKILANYFGG
ncbi:MAG: Cupredoxin [Acidocella sp.]|nr:Cupredoxin [Acidocella sp.]